MIKKVRLKFLTVSLLALISVFIVITTIFSASNNKREKERRDFILADILRENGPLKTPNSFKITTFNHEDYLYTYDSIAFTGDKVKELLTSIMQEEKNIGNIGDVYYQISVTPSLIKIAGIDRSNEISVLKQSLLTLILIEFTALAILGFIIWFSSKWIVKPLIISNQKQKEFISNASHELKTPLSVIKSNIDVLKDKYPNDEWLSYINDEVYRMSDLINQLLAVAITNESQQQLSNETFDLSNLLNSIILSYDVEFFEKHKTIETAIDDKVTITGNPIILKQLITIFIDNAIKHSDETGMIVISLTNHQKILLSFYNTGSNIEDSEKSLIFDRFFHKGKGTGLGLTIAAAIINQNGYKVTVNNAYQKSIEFIIELN
ncbi:MAG: HAMP domain-containing sensor histidine kinase [Acholeplasma sp.]|nr:HAMP domain-containing sensor histidine kinase [Acholeplasma sp.]